MYVEISSEQLIQIIKLVETNKISERTGKSMIRMILDGD